jgi:hypothetical protein
MAFKGKANLADIAPNHPFAHESIIIGGHLPPPGNLPQVLLPRGGSHGVNVSVSWGYELHDVHVSARKWKRIRAGEPVMVRSVGWYEGQSFECRWYFDLNAEYTLTVSYGDDGADGFIGNIWDATIESADGPQR